MGLGYPRMLDELDEGEYDLLQDIVAGTVSVVFDQFDDGELDITFKGVGGAAILARSALSICVHRADVMVREMLTVMLETAHASSTQSTMEARARLRLAHEGRPRRKLRSVPDASGPSTGSGIDFKGGSNEKTEYTNEEIQERARIFEHIRSVAQKQPRGAEFDDEFIWSRPSVVFNQYESIDRDVVRDLMFGRRNGYRLFDSGIEVMRHVWQGKIFWRRLGGSILPDYAMLEAFGVAEPAKQAKERQDAEIRDEVGGQVATINDFEEDEKEPINTHDHEDDEATHEIDPRRLNGDTGVAPNS
jgi:hypothetical protein